VSTSRKRRQFTAEFKADAVQFVLSGAGRPIAQVARELDINESLAYWVKAYRAEHAGPGAPSPVEAAKLAALEAENRRLAQENEFLKKGRGLLRQDAAVSEKFTLRFSHQRPRCMVRMTRAALSVSLA
jgi:transposase-like protein